MSAGQLRRPGQETRAPGKERYERSEEVVASITLWTSPLRQMRSINRENQTCPKAGGGEPEITLPQNVIQRLLLGELGLGLISALKSYLAGH
jgi:hypothetical protein